MKKVLAVLFCLAFASEGMAHVPQTGQIARFQPTMRKLRATPFVASGTVNLRGATFPYQLNWFAPKHYTVVLSEVPSMASSTLGTATGTWILHRKDGDCSLLSGGRRVSCPSAASWAHLELMGDPVEAPASMEADGYFAPQDRIYRESHSKDLEDETLSSEKRVTLELGRNGLKPKAVLQIKGPSYAEADNGLGAPVIRFDQSFLAPLFARLRYNGALYSIEAKSDLVPRRRYPRFQPILAETLKINRGLDLMVTVNRKISTKKPGEAPRFREGLVGIDSLRSQLSSSGEALLDALLISH